MSQPTPPMPNQPPAAPPPAPKKPRTNAIIIGAAVAIIAAIIGTGVVVVQAQDDDSKPAASTNSSTPAEDVVEPAVEEAEESEADPTFPPLSADDFTMTLRTTDRQCFGSAGCNVTVEPKLEFTGSLMDVDPDAVYEITYEIRGGDSGPVIETGELMDKTTLNYTPTSISTPSASTKITVEVTDVITQGA